MANPTPILILSDAPTSTTGLGRICRDLATRIATNLPEAFRVGTLGYGGVGSRALGFQQYSIQSRVTDNGWFVPELMHVWDDFAGTERGVVLTIWDASRMTWFARPDSNVGIAAEIGSWLSAAPFERQAVNHERAEVALKWAVAKLNDYIDSLVKGGSDEDSK